MQLTRPSVSEKPISGLFRTKKLQSNPTSYTSIQALDGLRAVAVLLVVWYHYNATISYHVSDANYSLLQIFFPLFEFGKSGVELFFVLSGFLLFIPYARALQGLQPFPTTGKFYFRRVLRIVPAYWVALLVYIALPAQYNQSPFSVLDVVAHFFLLHNYNTLALHNIHGIFWTMAIESQFYLILPVVAGWLYHGVQRGDLLKRGRLLLPLLILAPAFYGFVNTYSENHLPWINRHLSIFLLLTYIGVFATGSGLAFLYVAMTEGKLNDLPTKVKESWGRRLGLTGILCLFGYLVYEIFKFSTSNFVSPFGFLDDFVQYQLLAVGYGGVLFGVLVGWVNCRRFLSSAFMRRIGVLSYSIYLWHSAIIVFVLLALYSLFQSDSIIYVLGFPLTFGLVMGVCLLSHKFIEKPFIEFRRKPS